MKVNEEILLKSGFSHTEIQKIQNNIDNFGGTFEEVVKDLAKRFEVFLWVLCCCAVFFLFLIYSKSDDHGYVLGGGISLLVAILIIGLSQPPVISFKCWRLLRLNKS